MMRSVQMPAIEPMDPEVIKAFIQGFNDKKAELRGWPVLRLPSSATSNVVVLMAEENSLDRDLIARGAAETTLTIDGNRRRYGAILAIMDLVYYLRKHNEICSLREAYYHIKAFDPGHQFFDVFRDVRDCYQAIADVQVRPRGRVREAAGGLRLRAPLQVRQERDRERELALRG